jgi:hypothetical protein
MITELFLNLIFYVVGILLTPVQLVFQPLGSIAGLLEVLSYASIFIPMTTFGICMSIWVAYYGIEFIMTVINWIIGKIPTID